MCFQKSIAFPVLIGEESPGSVRLAVVLVKKVEPPFVLRAINGKKSPPDCLAVGGYKKTGGGFFPLLASSTNTGQSYTTTSNVALPGDAASGTNTTAALFDLTCSGTKCISVGFYYKTVGVAPLIAISNNSGQTYTTNGTITLPVDAASGSAQYAWLGGITCGILTCVTVGTYINTSGQTFPFHAISSDGGNTYTGFAG